MLLLANPKRLMVGYLLGAYTTSITLGLLIVFTLHGSGTESTSKHTIGPVEDIVIGLLAGRGRDRARHGARPSVSSVKICRFAMAFRSIIRHISNGDTDRFVRSARCAPPRE